MDVILPTLVAQAWASGLNVYGVVLLLNVGARLGLGDVAEPFGSDWVLAVSAVMFAIEFVVDKVPYADHVWDAIHTVVRPGVAAALGVATAGDAGASELTAGLLSGALALAAHGTKAGLRAAINVSPEPVTTSVASLTEDGLVATVIALLFLEPWAAAVAAAVLLLCGFALLTLAWRTARRMRAKLAPPSG